MSLRGAIRKLLAALLVVLAFGGASGCQDVDARTVFVWHAYRGDEERALADVALRFEATHPGVRVELLALPFEAYATKLESAVPHGHGPDVFIEAHERLGTYLRDGIVAPAGDAFPKDASVYDATTIAAVTKDGTRWAVPLSTKCVALYTSTALVPRAPEALEDVLDLPLPKGTYPLAYEAESAYYHAAILSAFGGELLDDKGQLAFDSAAGVRSLDFVKQLLARQAIPEEPSGALVTQLFASGKAAAVIGGPWLRADLGKKVKYRVTPLPVLRAAGGARMRPLLTVESAFLTPAGAKRELAREFVRFLSSRQGEIVLATEGHQVVARHDAWDDPAVAGDTDLAAFHQAVKDAVPTPKSTAMHAAWEPSNQAIEKVLRGGDPKAALAEARARFVDARKPPAGAASPGPAYLVLSLLLLAGAIAVVRRVRRASFRAELRRSMPAYAYVTHAVIAVVVLVVLPLVAGAVTSLFAGTEQHPRYIGLANYIAILTARGGDLLGHGSFYLTLLVTVLWTVVNVALHLAIGVTLGMLLSRPLMRLRAVYRVLLVLPWAVPSYVTALAWKGMFHRQFGAVNALLALVGAPPVSWFARFSTAFSANVATNVWLGFPFMMVVTMGALTSIPKDVLEAAEVDGATKWQRFWKVTFPLLRPAMLPAVLLGAIWTFNMFNVVFLVSGGQPDGSTDILVSDAYRWAFTRDAQYGYAAAYGVLIFLLLFFASKLSARAQAEAT